MSQGIIQNNYTHDNVKDYYGKILSGTKDLKTNACCSIESFPKNIQDIVENIDCEIIEKFYGCGSPIPHELEGRTILDLGCGTGRDVYIASCLVGGKGKAIGIDMTDEQLEVARRHINSQATRFGLKKPNTSFIKGYIEDLLEAGIEDNSVDVVISNCVINLSPFKRNVFSEIFRILKPGGELYFSDIFTNCRIPASLVSDPVLHGECLGGALYIEDFRRMLQSLGCLDFRTVSSREISLGNEELEKKIGMIDFYSMTIRAFKLESLEDICEDYGQVAIFKGGIPGSLHSFTLDDHHTFIAGKPMLVCGNTASMLQETRYAKHFEIIGDRSKHYGAFDCMESAENVGSCC